MMIKAFKVSKVFALLLFMLLLVLLLLLLHTVLLSFGPSCDGQFVIEEPATELKENVAMHPFVADNNTSTTSFVVANGVPSAEVLQVNVQSQQQQQQQQQKRVLSRKKRFVAFPEGSSFSTAVCMTTGVLGNPEVSYISMGLNWGIAYDLPNSTWVLQHAHGFPKNKESAGVESVDATDASPASPATPAAITDPNKGVKQFPIFTPGYKRRQRRELYGKLETLIDHMGYNGRDCILRALCESRQYFERTKMGMIGEMLRVVFSLPKQRIFTRELHESSDIKLYDHAYRKARAIDCAQQYDCGFSLLELALGRYSTPPPGYYKNY